MPGAYLRQLRFANLRRSELLRPSALRAAALALEAAQARYGVGAATFAEVTLARATPIQAQRGIVNANFSARSWPTTRAS